MRILSTFTSPTMGEAVLVEDESGFRVLSGDQVVWAAPDLADLTWKIASHLAWATQATQYRH